MKKFLLIALIVVLIALPIFCIPAARGDRELHYSEWISPDGVHYWLNKNNYTITPRYDHEGNLVIEDWDIQ